MNIPNDYWTQIPSDSKSVTQNTRDGVALEDDMALRALLPQIRPKRGRKRPEGEENVPSPALRQRVSPFPNDPSAAAAPSNSDGFATPTTDSPMMDVDSRGSHEDAQMSTGQHWISPTSTTANGRQSTFWDDALEPQLAGNVTNGSKSKLPSHRRGAKNVSSAWRLGGSEGVGKTRGRPPLNRIHVTEGASSSFNSADTRDHSPSGHYQGYANNTLAHSNLRHTAKPEERWGDMSEGSGESTTYSNGRDSSRNARLSVSLQVPEYRGGSATQMATTPPIPRIEERRHGHSPGAGGSRESTLPVHCSTDRQGEVWNQAMEQSNRDFYKSVRQINGTHAVAHGEMPDYFFEKMEDRTNVDALMAYFIRSTHAGTWVDEDGNPAQPASIEECVAIVNNSMQNIFKRAASEQSFLINIAAFAGGNSLMSTRVRCVRLRGDEDNHRYSFGWEYRLGEMRGYFTMESCLPRKMWKEMSSREASRQGDPNATNGEGASTLDWQRKYEGLLDEMEKKDRELMDLKAKVMMSLRDNNS